MLSNFNNMKQDISSTLEAIHVKSLKALTAPLNYLSRAKLWLQVLVAMVLGIAAGLLLNPDFGWLSPSAALAVGEWLSLPGKLFLALIQMIVVPLILASIVRGIASAVDLEQLKTTGTWLAVYFLSATVLAVVIGISVGQLVQPGSYVDSTTLSKGTSQEALKTQDIEEKMQTMAPGTASLSAQEIPQKFADIFPKNPISAIVEGEMLQIVIFAIVIGIGLLLLAPSSAKPLLDLFGSIQEVSMAIVGVAMSFAPIAVFGLLAQSMIKTGPDVLLGLGVYSASVIGAMMILYLVYIAIALVLGKRGIMTFLKAAREPTLIGFSTNSSAATMPVTVKSAEDALKVRPSIAQFVVPVGATINMGGTACYQGLTTLFMAQMFGMDLPLSALVALTATAVGASVGTPAVPGVGIIVLAGVLNSAGVPLTGLSLIIGLDRILERFRTSLNVTGDLAACAVMDRFMPGQEDSEGNDEETEADALSTAPYHEAVIKTSKHS